MHLSYSIIFSTLINDKVNGVTGKDTAPSCGKKVIIIKSLVWCLFQHNLPWKLFCMKWTFWVVFFYFKQNFYKMCLIANFANNMVYFNNYFHLKMSNASQKGNSGWLCKSLPVELGCSLQLCARLWAVFFISVCLTVLRIILSSSQQKWLSSKDPKIAGYQPCFHFQVGGHIPHKNKDKACYILFLYSTLSTYLNGFEI